MKVRFEERRPYTSGILFRKAVHMLRVHIEFSADELQRIKERKLDGFMMLEKADNPNKSYGYRLSTVLKTGMILF